jgi:predicted DCC family thiol-disulfide oxidoreductase YuxK
VAQNYKIILFDGVCNLCNWSVNFIIERDTKNIFKFAALQTEKGKELIKKFNLDTSNLTTLILIEGEKYYTKSTAALRITKELKGLWKLFYIFIISPPFIRNFMYDLIARYRYKLFGKRDVCRVPGGPDWEKFL